MSSAGHDLSKIPCQTGLTIRGDGRGESHGNFSQLLDLFQRSDDMVKNCLAKKTDKYTCHDVQNDLLQVMVNQII